MSDLYGNRTKGIFNYYRPKMPFLEVLVKDVRHLSNAVSNYKKNGFQSKNIFVFPDYPSKRTTLYKIAQNLGYNLSNKLKSNNELTINWEDITFRKSYNFSLFNASKEFVVNLASNDISKEFVEQHFEAVFAYSTFVDPTVFEGKCVQKNTLNAAHDGKIIDCPIPQKKEGFIYQIIIDNNIQNENDEESVLDYRLPIINKKSLDFTYSKQRQKSVRFLNITDKTSLLKTIDVFNKEEVEKINSFCENIHLDFGELDILRDNISQKIYIIDVNNTPHGPPANIAKPDFEKAISILSASFKKAFLDVI